MDSSVIYNRQTRKGDHAHSRSKDRIIAYASTTPDAVGVIQWQKRRSGPIEYMPWVAGAFAEPAQIKNGNMITPQGLGLEIPEEVIRQFRLE